MLILVTTIQPSFGSPSDSNQGRKGNKKNPNFKEAVKLSLFTDDMILYIEKMLPENYQSLSRNLVNLQDKN